MEIIEWIEIKNTFIRLNNFTYNTLRPTIGMPISLQSSKGAWQASIYKELETHLGHAHT
jgi:predicted restriction endonuclease